MEYAAIRHDMDKRDCYALEYGTFLLRIQTKKDDMQKVLLHYQDKYIPRERKDTRKTIEMKKVASDRFCDYYEAIIQMDLICLRYFFELVDTKGVHVFYGNYEFYENSIDNKDYMFDCPQNLREEELFSIPEWAKNKVVYQIFPSRFANDEEVDEHLWYKAPIDGGDMLGGNIRGIIQKLDYLKELGIDVVYMTPIFAANSQHKYDIKNYYEIDPSFGCKEDLKKLVEEAHKRGMYVVLDAVFNHSGREFFAFQDLKQKEALSEYKEWYYPLSYPLDVENGQVVPYKTFGYSIKMPKLRLSNPEVADYFVSVACYWIKECDIDGWRLDVGDEVIHHFWKKLRKAVREVKKDTLLVGEVWHYSPDFLEGDEWDTVMNYPFYFAVQNFVAYEEINVSHFWANLQFLQGKLHKKVLPVLWNFIGSHDTSRFLYRSKENKAKQRVASALQLLLPGMPMIYYGDEYGMTGADDPDNRRGMAWKESYQDGDMYSWYQRLLRIRKKYKCITEGSMEVVMCEDKTGMLILKCFDQEKQIYLLFHGRDGGVDLTEYKGWKDLLSDNIFDGVIGGYDALILMK